MKMTTGLLLLLFHVGKKLHFDLFLGTSQTDLVSIHPQIHQRSTDISRAKPKANEMMRSFEDFFLTDNGSSHCNLC